MPKQNPYYDPDKPHHTPNGFCNIEPLTITTRDVKKWMIERKMAQYPHPPMMGYSNFLNNWWQKADFNLQGDAIWWLGHSTTLIRLNGVTVLTDPVFSLRASPVSFMGGCKRSSPPAASIAELPNIDVIVISHDHYDHLDRPSIQQLIKRFPDIHILVPLGLKNWMLRRGAKNVTELDWWQESEINQITFTCVPARHWSHRRFRGKNTTLWSGWTMSTKQNTSTKQKTAYFMGDTGYSTTLAEIAERLGPIDIAAIPIGAYAPRWMMESQHIDPEQAVQLFQELKCKKALAIHWGTFELADETIDEPPILLNRSLIKRDVSPEQFQVVKIGTAIKF